MIKHLIVAGAVFSLLMAVVGGFLALIYGPQPETAARTPVIETQAQPAFQPAFAPPDPEQAPPPLRDYVALGYQVMMFTGQYLSGPGDEAKTLACRNCHFEAGRSQDGISLVGVAAKYPRPVAGTEEATEVATLADQVAFCFRRNIGLQPPAENDRMFQGILYYLQWLSRGVPVYEPVRWLGLQPLQLRQQPDIKRGRQRYARTCAQCHGPDGQGSVGPALWGAGSFTSGSQFSDPALIGSFIHRFMPYKNPGLPPTEAADAAAFVLDRPRREPGAAPLPRASDLKSGKPADPGLAPAEATPEKAPPLLAKARGELRRIAEQIQQKGPGRIPPGQAAAAPGPAHREPPAGSRPATLQEKRNTLDRSLPDLKPPKWTSGAVIHPEETKPGHKAGTPLIGIPPAGRRLPQPPGHPAETPRRAPDAAEPQTPVRP